MIYWDANSTYGIKSTGMKSLAAYNPSSIHRGGQNSKIIIEECREALIRAIDAKVMDVNVVFTSGATEANNTALWSALYPYSFKGDIIVSAVEHPSILEPAKNLEDLGAKSILINPDANRDYSADQFLEKLTDRTRIVCIMLANNENGQVFPVKEIIAGIRQKHPNVWIHVDAVQGLGKLKFSFTEINADSMSFSAHKIGALPGIGALVSKRSRHITPLISGGPQELRFRAGTENWVGIDSMLQALNSLYNGNCLEENIKNMAAKRDKLISMLNKEIPSARILFADKQRLPNTLSLNFENLSADDLVVSADLRGLCISSGSACASGKPDPSHVLVAYGMPAEAAKSTVRVSLRADIPEEELSQGVKILKDCISEMQSRKK